MQLKRIFPMTLVVVVALSSCRKSHSCQCSVTLEKQGYYPYTTSTVQAIDGKTSRRKADKICAYTEKELDHSVRLGQATAGESVTTSCAVK
ncbi:MAG: hypothetical protein JST26_15760 [Bacteroidetes bacterium]|nr:hypothetical protein [Bacteroidota bacterium]